MPIEQKVESVRRGELNETIGALNRDGWKVESITPDYISAESFVGIFLLLCTRIESAVFIRDPDLALPTDW